MVFVSELQGSLLVMLPLFSYKLQTQVDLLEHTFLVAWEFENVFTNAAIWPMFDTKPPIVPQHEELGSLPRKGAT
jgi:hypothetical protein